MASNKTSFIFLGQPTTAQLDVGVRFVNLTFLIGCEKDAKAALAAELVRPHTDDSECGDQHDVVGHRGAELALQVFYRTETRQGRDKNACFIIVTARSRLRSD